MLRKIFARSSNRGGELAADRHIQKLSYDTMPFAFHKLLFPNAIWLGVSLASRIAFCSIGRSLALRGKIIFTSEASCQT
jgi:hypothetical protein